MDSKSSTTDTTAPGMDAQPFRREFQHRDTDFQSRGIGRSQSSFPESPAREHREMDSAEGGAIRSPFGGRDRSDFEPPRRTFSEDATFKGIRKSGSSTGRPVRKEVSSIREEGIICSVKDQFGFIKCVERDDELFFHFSELPRESPPTVGMEVEFSIATDTRNGKLSAVTVTELPKGTVLLEDVDPEVRVGSIVKEVRDEGEFGAGEIETKTDSGEKETLKFSSRNLLEPKITLRAGDEVKFKVVISRRSKVRSATDVVIHRFGGQRETGIIHSLKDTFGFIDCCENPISLFFHFRDVCLLQPDQQELFVGMEVEFTHGLDKTKKPIATRIRALPKGTVQFETTLPEKVRGMVTRQLANMGARPHPEEMGLIKLISDDDLSANYFAALKPITPASSGNASFPSLTPSSSGSGMAADLRFEKLARLPSITSSPSQGYDMNIFPFAAGDLTNSKSNPKEGDEVEFNVVVRKRQQRKRATNVSIVSEAPESVEHGVIASVHKSYGHIVCLEREEDMFFHFTDVFDNQPDMKNEDIHVGMELEFRVIIDPRNHKKKAVNIKILSKGSIQSETVGKEVFHGVVFRESRPGQTQNSFGLRRHDECGLIDFDNAETGLKETLPFINLDLNPQHQKDRVQLWPGDEVDFSIGLGQKTQTRYATRITRTKNRELPRERGTVSSIKNYFGFLNNPNRDEEVYFHFSELEPFMDKKEIEKVRIGNEFEYSVARDSWADNKPIAVMLKPIIKKEDEVALNARYYGVVDRAAGVQGQVEGRITFTGPGEPVVFDFEDVDKRFMLKKGDRVEFSIQPNNKPGERRAVKIVLMRESGTVKTVNKNSFGYITADDSTTVSFNMKDVNDKSILREGESVEFLRVFNHNKGHHLAVEIRRNGDSSTGTRITSSGSSTGTSNRITSSGSSSSTSNRITSSGSSSSADSFQAPRRTNSKTAEKVYVVRNPKVADSGPAFGTGRGRLLNPNAATFGTNPTNQ